MDSRVQSRGSCSLTARDCSGLRSDHVGTPLSALRESRLRCCTSTATSKLEVATVR